MANSYDETGEHEEREGMQGDNRDSESPNISSESDKEKERADQTRKKSKQRNRKRREPNALENPQQTAEKNRIWDRRNEQTLRSTCEQHPNISPPPAFKPNCPTWQNGAKGLQNCLHKHTYIWQYNGMNYWFYPERFGREIIGGFIWSRKRWSTHGVNRQSIRSHQCFGIRGK